VVPCKIIVSTIAKMVDLYTSHNTWVGVNMILYSVFCVGMNNFSYYWFPFVFMKKKKSIFICVQIHIILSISIFEVHFIILLILHQAINRTKKKPWNNFTKCHNWIRKWTNDGLDSGWIRAQIWMIENEYQISKIRFKNLYLTWDQNSITS